jgi:carbamoyl-phosphate synthase large subunit
VSPAAAGPVTATVAVTGMNATDNPAPGVAVARCLRDAADFRGRVVGLGYDALDPGFYAQGLLDGGSIIPYPSAGKAALRDHLLRVRETFGLDVLLPTLDSELRAVVALEGELRDLGVATLVPTLDSIERASKPKLPALADGGRLRIPESEAITTADALPQVLARLGLPAVVKGLYYGARVVHGEAEALHAFHHYAATWGVPVVVQRHIAGEEYNVAALGDGTGATVGAVAMRKLMLTDKGKGWSGVTVGDPGLLDIAAAVIGALRWRGGLEVEILKEAGSGDLYVLEINPRFPAWIYLSAGAGQNLPWACVRLALGLPVPTPLAPYRVGTMFVRIALDQISDLATFGALSASGVLPPPGAAA